MSTTKRVTTKRREKNSGAKEIRTDTDLQALNKVVLTAVTARTELANVKPHTDEQAPRALVNPSPWISKLTEQQRERITKALIDPNGPSMRAIARDNGVSLASVSHLAVKNDLDPARRLKIYGRRMRKRLPITEKVEVYRSIALGELDGVRPADRLRALERADALEGIVTAREQRESESNQVHVGPLFILPTQAAPTVDTVTVSVRPIQDKS